MSITCLLIALLFGKADGTGGLHSYDGARKRGDGVAALAPQPGAKAQGESERARFGREGEQYKLRPSGHRREVVENSSRTTTYTYDELYRLTSESIANDANANNGDIGYSLDKVGNRLNRSSQLSAVGSQLNQTFNARDWLNGDSYDSNGNTIAGQLADLSLRGTDVYDFENRLIVRTKSDGTKIEIRYDADGHRIAKQIFNASAQSVSQTSWIVDTNNLTGYCQVFEERIDTPASGTTRRVYTYGISLSQATSLNAQPSTVNYYTTDGHGNVRELTDASGTITDRYDYDAFGNLTFQSGTTANAYRYCGEQFDGDLGLYYLRARYLNTDSGRFWSTDEFEGRDSEPLTLHKYLYANSNPASYLDPSGLVGLLDTQIGQMVESTLNKMSTVNMRFVMRKSGCWAVKIGLEKGIESGVYLFLDASGASGFYTGMSVDIERRLAEHAKRVIQPILRISANVSPQVLRQLEQTIYNIVKEAAAAAGKNTTNKINPLREQMRKLLSKAIPLC